MIWELAGDPKEKACYRVFCSKQHIYINHHNTGSGNTTKGGGRNVRAKGGGL